MRRPSTFALGLALVLGCSGVLVTGRANAQTTGEQQAEKLFNEAIALVSAGKYEAACPKFEESQRLDPALGTQFDLADCYEHTGRKGSARRLFIEVADAAKAAGKTEREKSSRDRANALEAIAPRLTVVVPASASGDHLEVSVDGAALPAAKWSRAQPIDAGPHTVTASAPGKKPFASKIALQDGKSVEVKIPELESEPVVAPPPANAANGANGAAGADDQAREAGNGQRRTGLIVGGIGVVGLLVGGGAGLYSVIEHGQAKDLCADHSQCPDPDGRSKWNAATDAGTVSTIGFVVGGMGVVAGALLYFTATKAAPANAASAPAPRWWLTPSVGMGTAGLVAGGTL